MSKVERVAYYQPVNGLTGPKLKEFKGSNGCIPIETQKTVSIDRLAPGEAPPSPRPPPAPKPEQLKAKQEQEKQKAAQAKNVQASAPQLDTMPKDQQTKPHAEVCENLPIFDLQDVPIAMDNLKWPVSAKLARRWFAGPARVFNGDMNSIQPIVDNVITLDWVLQFGNVREKYDNLLKKDIYSDDALEIAHKKVRTHITRVFREGAIPSSFNTPHGLKDLRQFHINWQFQRADISGWDTVKRTTLNDLTGALAHFGLYVAVGVVEVTVEQYYKYAGRTEYCIDPKIAITHVYVYIKDSYSFRDRQYLGHWNKNGVIVAIGGMANKNIQAIRTSTDFDAWGNSYPKPVDTRRGLFGKFKESDVYFPVHNSDYDRWREKHKRGEDFMIYSKPVLVKLKKPITFQPNEQEEICRPG